LLEVSNFVLEVADGILELADGLGGSMVEVIDFIAQANDLIVGCRVLLMGFLDGLSQVL
jgi:hypothetical protein